MSRRAINNMNTMYPNATAEELASSDNVCIICREEMVPNGTAKRLPCNHIFHVSCLRSWFQRQQTCPTCRMDVLHPPANAPGIVPNMNNLAGRNIPAAQAGRPGQAAFVLQPNPLILAMPNLFQAMMQAQVQAQAHAQAQAPQAQGATPEIPPQNQGQTPQAAQANAGTQPGASSTSTMPPMFGFPPFMPFPAPMPPPPLELGHLSTEELVRMEGNERQNIEARIRCLRNIQTMLDAAVLQLQMYNTTVSSTTVPPVFPTTSTTPSTSTNAAPSTSSDSNQANETPAEPVPGPSTSSNANGSADPTQSFSTSGTDAETIRQRRLHHLNSRIGTSSSSSTSASSNAPPNANLGGDTND